MSGRNISGLYYLKFLKQIGLEYQLTHTDPPNPPRTQWTYFSTLWGSTPYKPNIVWNLMAPTKLWPLTTYPSSTQTHQTHPIWPFLHFMTFFTVQTMSFIKPHDAQYPLTQWPLTHLAIWAHLSLAQLHNVYFLLTWKFSHRSRIRLYLMSQKVVTCIRMNTFPWTAFLLFAGSTRTPCSIQLWLHWEENVFNFSARSWLKAINIWYIYI